MNREPIIIRGAIVAAVTALVHVLVVFGVLDIDPSAEAAIGGLIDLVGTAVLVIWSRGAVTPTADPKDAAGNPLVSAK
jgi:hypothetical protein